MLCLDAWARPVGLVDQREKWSRMFHLSSCNGNKYEVRWLGNVCHSTICIGSSLGPGLRRTSIRMSCCLLRSVLAVVTFA